MIPKEIYMISNPYSDEGRTTVSVELLPKSGQDKRREKRKAQRKKK